MTREENIAKLAEIRTSVEELTRAFNDAVQNGKIEESVKADRAMTDKINEYTATARDMCFEDCKSADDPMLAAVKTLSYATIGIKDEQKGDDKAPVRIIVDRERQIDLLKLDKFCGGIGADKNWMHVAQKMNFLLTAQKANELGLDPTKVNDSYAMSEIARQFSMGKNPTSKTNLLKTLQMAVTAMVGEGYKATSHDVNFLLSVYSRKNRKALTVSCSNHRNFRGYIMEICHRIVTNKAYELEYSTKREF